MPNPAVPVALLFALMVVLGGAQGVAEETSIGEPRQAELRHLLMQDCGSCHGLTLRGGLGPPITPEALADRDRDTMVAVILYGRPGTPMPPWATILAEHEVRWLVDLLYEGSIQ
ncbi:Cytochrome c55X precursor NirC [Thioalkalivibrio nitratireducens DSM 14787]|uniref:Cytochrome c55X NirC n=1 Tax=Thioalkalivibrio nitratireducens (strain DSM 14787 / UNIQEM 213 / ALEN2) TaxID=1255043 RepID=L0DWA1_THIND|nr:cytochrome c [Thioalkalivibrio nitratireducens]AGA33308.1 Cytochrome c55X precursor NirC [Thioalkalivibrio nitratireducens DSM 14787]